MFTKMIRNPSQSGSTCGQASLPARAVLGAALAMAAWVWLAPPTAHAQALRIVGSSTVFPFSALVAENYGRGFLRRTPVVESTGTGGGMKLFCAPVSDASPDLSNASRRIKQSEYQACRDRKTRLMEIMVGYDGVVVANAKSGPRLDLSLQQLYLALAAQVPQGACARANACPMQSNPNRRWSDIASDLPNVRIEVLGPPPTSGTRDAFLELVMEAGAKQFPGLAALRKQDKSAFRRIAHTLREDGAWIDAGENDNLIVQKLASNANALGVFGFSFLEENRDRVQGAQIGGTPPRFDLIANGTYPVSRSLYVYMRLDKTDRTEDRQEFMEEFLSDEAMDEEDGYLIDRGLIPLPKPMLRTMQERVERLEELRL